MTADKLVRGIDSVASLPLVYHRLDEVVNDLNSTNRDVAEIISEDTGLAARLLRFANSAFYGFPSKVDTISRAVTVLGTKQLRDLVLATVVVDLFKDTPDEAISMESFWQHSVACGVTARILAVQRREANVERHFVAGLLHDIGRLILVMKMPEKFTEVMSAARDHGALLFETEKQELGLDHALVGGALLKAWGLPEPTVTAVAFHHHPAGAAAASADVAIVHVANVIANAVWLGSSGERFVPDMDTEAWHLIGLPETVLPQVVSHLRMQYCDAIRLISPVADSP